MIRHLTLIFVLAAYAAAPALAGSPEDAPQDPAVIAPLPVDTSPDWTGFYGGLQLGLASVDTSISGADEGLIVGVTGGYDYDFGSFVVGGGFDYDFTDTSVAGNTADLENVFRVKLRAGFEIGNGLLYGTGGYAQADTDNLGSDDGYFLGAGYENLITPNFSYGGELLFHEFDNYNSTGVDVDATTVQLRGTFRF
ncbi:MAG: outer membrane beta-barrel protein [Pseudomonadota bacterium]